MKHMQSYRRMVGGVIFSTAFLLSILIQAPTPARAATFTFEVTTPADGHDTTLGDGLCYGDMGSSGYGCSLRAAIEEATAQQLRDPSQTIYIGIPDLSGVGMCCELNRGQLEIVAGTHIVIQGADKDVVNITLGNIFNPNPNGAVESRIFDIAAGGTLELYGVTISGGKAGIGYAGHWHGGGIHNHGTLILDISAVTGNAAAAGWGGGGITNAAGARADVSYTTISNNVAPANGGGIENYGTLTASGVTVIDNTASNGSNIFSTGSFSMN